MNEVEKIILNLGITPNIDGFNYMRRAIEKCVEAHAEHKQRPQYCVIYQEIAKEYGRTPSSVERAMRHAITKARKTSTPLFRKMFVYDDDVFDSMRVTTSFFVENVARHVIGG